MKTNQKKISDILLVTLRVDELREIFREIIKSELKGIIPIEEKDDDLITSKQACIILRVSLPTLHVWKSEGRIKFYRIGTRIRFKKKDLLDSLETLKKYGKGIIKPNNTS